jgi:hypothetical protein
LFGNYETPAVISKVGKAKLAKGEPLDMTVYGRKEFPRESATQGIGIIRYFEVGHLSWRPRSRARAPPAAPDRRRRFRVLTVGAQSNDFLCLAI